MVSATTVRAWLRAAGIGPAGKRGATAWRKFIRAHRQSLLAVDFFTVETIWLQRVYVLFFIELGSRPRAHRGLHAEFERAVGDTTGSAPYVDARRVPGVVPLLPPRTSKLMLIPSLMPNTL